MEDGGQEFAVRSRQWSWLWASILGASGAQADIIAPQTPPATAATMAGRRAPARSTLRPAASTRRTSSSNRPPGTRRSASPSSSSNTRPPARLGNPGRELKTVRVDLPVGLSVNPQATAAVRRWRPSKPARRPARRARSRRKRRDRARLLASPSPSPLPTVDRLQHRSPARRAGALRLQPRRQRRLPGGRRRLGRRLPRGLHDRRPRTRLAPGSKALILKNRLVFDGRAGDGTFITTPSTCLDPAIRRRSSTSTRPTCSPARSLKRKPGYDSPQAPTRLESDPARDDAERMRHDPLRTRRSRSTRTPPQTDSPAGAAVEVDVPHIQPAAANDRTTPTCGPRR